MIDIFLGKSKSNFLDKKWRFRLVCPNKIWIESFLKENHKFSKLDLFEKNRQIDVRSALLTQNVNKLSWLFCLFFNFITCWDTQYWHFRFFASTISKIWTCRFFDRSMIESAAMSEKFKAPYSLQFMLWCLRGYCEQILPWILTHKKRNMYDDFWIFLYRESVRKIMEANPTQQQLTSKF